MSTPFVYDVVLRCLHKINGERTVFSIYHLLCGKKSSQTIQDAHLFQLAPFFNTYNAITRQEFVTIIEELKASELIEHKQEDVYQLTQSGIFYVEDEKAKHPFLKYLDGYRFQTAELFWARLSLLVQVASHLIRNESRFIPIQSNRHVQSWLKIFIQRGQFQREKLGHSLYQELSTCLEGMTDLDPAIFVIRLTGHERIGLTEMQAASVLKLESTLYHYQFLALLHEMMNRLLEGKSSYPLLYSMISDLHNKALLTDSTKKTYQLLSKGYSIEEIGKIRKLKVNTIQDHVVELALQLTDFDITPYVKEEKIVRIIEAKDKTGSKQLRHMKEIVPEASYFEIRLVMSRYGEEK